VVKLVDTHVSGACAARYAGSSPAFGTFKGSNEHQLEPFFDESTKLCQRTVPEKYPYKRARLVHHDYDSTKRWYVDFMAWDVSKDKLVRYRLFDQLNRKKIRQFLPKRIDLGNNIVKQINAQLAAGKVLGKDTVQRVITQQPKQLTLLSSLEYVREQKKLNGHRNSYSRVFKTAHSIVADYLTYKKQPDYLIKEFDRADALELMAYVRDVRGLANKSINNFFTNLSIAFHFIEEQGDRKLWVRDPLTVIKRLPVESGKHAAYTDRQITIVTKQIRKTIDNARPKQKAEYLQLEFFIQFIYYSLARPNEILSLKVRQIDLSQNRLMIKGSESKNKKSEYIPLNDVLRLAVVKSGVLAHGPDEYVFGRQGTPGPQPRGSNFFWRRHKRMLEQTGLLEVNPNFTLYSYKHSGAVSLYRATKDIKLVQRQCRHSSSTQTDTYLRDLGEMTDDTEIRKWKGAF